MNNTIGIVLTLLALRGGWLASVTLAEKDVPLWKIAAYILPAIVWAIAIMVV
jgi:hypothetical protein